MSDLSYERKVKLAYKGLFLLAIVTLIEVFLSLLHRGHLISGLENNTFIFYGAALLIIVLSFYKAYFIIYEFMHLKYEAKRFATTVLLPAVLLIWLIIAYLWDADSWGNYKKTRGEDDIEQVPQTNDVGMIDVYMGLVATEQS